MQVTQRPDMRLRLEILKVELSDHVARSLRLKHESEALLARAAQQSRHLSETLRRVEQSEERDQARHPPAA